MYIYKTTNNITNKIYIGQSQKDKSDNEEYLGSGLILLKSIKKHGKHNFSKEILHECSTKDELNDLEIYYIKKFNSTNELIGYNIVTGGQGGYLGEVANNKKKVSLKIFFEKNPDARKGENNSRYDSTEYEFYNIETGLFFKGTCFSLAKQIGLKSSHSIKRLVYGFKKICYNWILADNKLIYTAEYLKESHKTNLKNSINKKNSKIIITIYNIKTHEIINGNLLAVSNKCNIKTCIIKKLISGERLKYNDWILYDKKDIYTDEFFHNRNVEIGILSHVKRRKENNYSRWHS